MTKVKLCGLRSLNDVQSVLRVKSDYAGFILSSGFKRSIDIDTFKEMSDLLYNSGIMRVGVFVNEPINNIEDKYLSKIDLVQLHGDEDEEYISTLKRIANKPVIKAFTIKSESDIKKACLSSADYILLDSGTGTGTKFDHSLIKGLNRPFFLAGGLTPDNVGEAICCFKPFAVDASSSLETDGIKDETKMAAFVNAVRQKG